MRSSASAVISAVNQNEEELRTIIKDRKRKKGNDQKKVSEKSSKNRRVNLITGVDRIFPIPWNSIKKWEKGAIFLKLEVSSPSEAGRACARGNRKGPKKKNQNQERLTNDNL